MLGLESDRGTIEGRSSFSGPANDDDDDCGHHGGDDRNGLVRCLKL